jgi:ribosomal-protein-alanine N-acetyltransferase
MRASRALHRPWISMPETPEKYATYIARTEDPRAAMFIGCRVEDGAIIGFLNISEIVRGPFKNAFLGYGGVAEFAGQGYMTEALRLVLREAFTKLGLHRLEANIQPGNTASIALAKRCGFELEGVRRATSRSAAAGAITSAGRSAPRRGARSDDADPGT